MTQHERPDKGPRWFATFFISSFVAQGTAQLAFGLITSFKDHDDHTVTGALFMVMALLVVLLVRWKKWPHVPAEREMSHATARRVLTVVTATYALLAAIALIEGVVDHGAPVEVHVIAFGAMALAGGRALTKSARGPMT